MEYCLFHCRFDVNTFRIDWCISCKATSILVSVSTAFFGAAIPEEIAKFLMLWLLLRKNPYFDEKMVGIVYAVCVSLGFAALENIMYLFTNAEAYLSVGIARAIFAVLGHFCFGDDVPDEKTVWKYRDIMSESGIGERLFYEIQCLDL